MDLKECAEIYFRHKDIFKKEIKDIIFSERGFIIKRKVKDVEIEEVVIILDSSGIEVKDLLEKKYWLVLESTSESINFVIDNWDKMANLPNVRILFIDLKKDLKVLITPNIHSKIFENVEKSITSLLNPPKK